MARLSRRDVGFAAIAAAMCGGVRVQAEAPAEQPPDPVGQSHDSGAIRAVWMPVSPGIWRATLGAPETHTPVRDRLIPPATHAFASLPTVAVPPIAAPQGQRTRRGIHASLSLAADELMYGFGLQLQSFQQRSRKRILRVNADPLADSGDSHAPVPFYVTTHGYGILIDTFRHAEVNCGQLHPAPRRPETTASKEVLQPAKLRQRDRSKTAEVQIEVPRAQGVDLYLFAGPGMLDVVRRYNLFSGSGVAPPEWGLGFWYRPEMHLRDEEVLHLAQEFRDRKIPCDVLGLEPGWQTHAYSCSFAWEPSRFPDPKQFVARAGQSGYRVNLWEHAFTHPTSPLFPALQPHSGDYAVWEGLVPDFAGESARKIFGDYHGSALVDIGISGFKLDECDNSDYTNGWSWPDFASYPSGLDGEQMHGAFGLRYQHAVLDAFRQRKRETYSLVRSSGALAAPYPFVLYSDLYDHRQFVRGLVNSGFTGLLWCPEVRDASSEEDLLRRLQTVMFAPVAMVNAWYIRNPPWKQIARDENNQDRFAPRWQKLEARCREIIGWRMSLVPYLRAAFSKYQADGTPPFRSPVLDFPDDPALQEVDDEFMVGDRLLVAPLFAGEAKRTVILPTGSDWHDLWTGKLHRGGERIVFARDYESIPAFVRKGSVLPWARIGSHADDPTTRQLDVRVYGDGSLPWHGAGKDLAGLVLQAQAGAGARGSVTPAHAPERPYQVVEWKQFG